MSAVAPSQKRNNFLQTENIIQQMKYLILLETLLGVNRLYLCGYRKCVLWLSYVYDVILLLVVGIFLILGDLFTATQHFYKNTSSIEYVLLGFSALLLQNKNLHQFFSSLQSFDEKLNIHDEVSLLSPKRWYLYGVGAVLLYNILEYLFCLFFVFYLQGMPFLIYIIYLPTIVQDIEIVFFSYLLASILKRLCVLKAHVVKVFRANIRNNKDLADLNKLETLEKRVNLDVSSLHKVYDQLHKCSEQLNSVMSLSMIVILVASGLSTIMILKNTIVVFQIMMYYDHVDIIRSTTIFSIGRCIKYIILLAVPCFITNRTKSEVVVIRTMIYDTLDSIQLDKIERCKVKAFFQLARENEFAYTLWGVVNLDTTLLLSYSSLCTTYLIIVIQFSKFFD